MFKTEFFVIWILYSTMDFILNGTEEINRDMDNDRVVIFRCGHKIYASGIDAAQKNQLDFNAKTNMRGTFITLRCCCGNIICRNEHPGFNVGKIRWSTVLTIAQREMENLKMIFLPKKFVTKKMAQVTANGQYRYDTVYNGKTLGEWVNLNHHENCKVNGWIFTALRPGAFGFDNIACSLVAFFKIYHDFKLTDDNSLAAAIHDGWIENYIYWRDNKPWLGAGKTTYFKAAKPIGDAQRDMCSQTEFDDLPEEEQKKDIIFVTFMKKCLKID